MEKSPELSVIIPLYNEQESIPHLLRELLPICDATRKESEVILVDDGSSDQTYALLLVAAEKDARLKVIRLSRNFGQQAAYSAGIDYCRGDMTILMDGDLQYPPSMIPTFLQYAHEGYDIVIGERLENRQNTPLREWIGRRTYKLLSRITGLEFRNACDFGLYQRSTISVLRQLPEKDRFLRGMLQWIGFKKIYIPYVAEQRRYGVPKYTLRRLVGLIMSGVTSFSAFPLRIAFWVGILTTLVSVAFGLFVVYYHFTHSNPAIAGWASTILVIMIVGSVQLLILGVMGEYMYKMFNEIKGRPQYIIATTKNINTDMAECGVYGAISIR